jgi:hypothetical protein
VRQFLSVRFWVTLAALMGLAAALWVFLPRSSAPAADTPAVPDVGVPAEHDIDLIEPLFAVTGTSDFAIADGVTEGELRLVIDGTRNATVVAGTPGEITCETLGQGGTCAFAADLLGDAVLWFSIFPADARGTINLPAIRELRDENRALLANDWVVLRSSVVTRSCDEDTTSLADFVRTFGDEAVSVFSVPEQRIIRVVCRPGAG